MLVSSAAIANGNVVLQTCNVTSIAIRDATSAATRVRQVRDVVTATTRDATSTAICDVVSTLTSGIVSAAVCNAIARVVTSSRWRYSSRGCSTTTVGSTLACIVALQQWRAALRYYARQQW
jgi:hypothetical protein